MKLKTVILLGLIFISFTITHADMRQKDNRILKRFDYHGIVLEESRIKDQFEQVKKEYMDIPVDDLLIGYRKRAGLNAPGNELGGWYSDDVFSCFGQILSGLSRMFAATQDISIRRKVDELVEGWTTCVRSDGYFYYSNKPNAPHYVYEKMVGGLVDAYVYCNNNTAKEMLSKITDWAIKNLDREKPFSSVLSNIEWYTLSENLYRAYWGTGDLKYRDFAEIWEFTEYWNYYAFNKNVFERHNDYHAYSHVNTLSGAATAYLIKGDRWYLNALINAHDYLVNTQCFATGGYGPRERFLQRDALVESLSNTDFHFETQCGSWAVFKLCKYLLEFTGDARFGNWIERLMYNGIGASVGLGEHGEVQYTSNYSVHGGQKIRMHPWSCCAGTRPMAVADYYDLIWFHGSNGDIYLNIYTPSSLETRIKGSDLKLTCRKAQTEFANIVTISVNQPTYFSLNFRVPDWIDSPPILTINGNKIHAQINEKHWIEVEREWSDGDKVALDFPVHVRASRIDPDKPMPAALVYGPIVLACEPEGATLVQKYDIDKLASELRCVDEQELIFSLPEDSSLRFRPYYSYRYQEPYLMYIDKDAAVQLPLVFSGDWKYGMGLRYSNEAGAEVSCQFEGTGIRWIAKRFDDSGKAEVFIDGKMQEIVDLYDPGREIPFQRDFVGLSHGNHTIVIRVTGEKRPESKNSYVNIIAFESISIKNR